MQRVLILSQHTLATTTFVSPTTLFAGALASLRLASRTTPFFSQRIIVWWWVYKNRDIIWVVVMIQTRNTPELGLWLSKKNDP